MAGASVCSGPRALGDVVVREPDKVGLDIGLRPLGMLLVCVSTKGIQQLGIASRLEVLAARAIDRSSHEILLYLRPPTPAFTEPPLAGSNMLT